MRARLLTACWSGCIRRRSVHNGGRKRWGDIMKIVIVGAGIVGACVAHALLDAGHDAVILDREGPASGTSQGNAGWIAHIDIEPLVSPKVWRRLPRWLVDPLGPLAIRPSYLPQLVPWLARFV